MRGTLKTLVIAIAFGGCAGAGWAVLQDARDAVADEAPAAGAAELGQDLLAKQLPVDVTTP